jgi:hypothetical protein
VEIVVRGSLTYIMLFLVLRFLLKRQTGVIGIADLLRVSPCNGGYHIKAKKNHSEIARH